jgi:glucose-6-phosphate isomerase
MTSTPALTQSKEWQAMLALAATPLPTLNELFRTDPQRAQRYHLSAAGLQLDYSKNLITDQIKQALLDLAKRAGLQEQIAALFSGAHLNNTEDRPALHMLLRSPHCNTAREQQVHAALAHMQRFVAAVHEGQWRGHNNTPITTVVNIGIGGSDLGPAMAYAALTPFHSSRLQCHFVSNVDPVHLGQTLASLDAHSTLFVIASKTFTTIETMQNANAARAWVLASGIPASALKQHFVAVSANTGKAAEFGIATDNIFPMWDWVGGRYSLWSAIGLPIALGIGMDNFRALLHGAHLLDEHFQHAEPAENIPVILGLLTHWYYHGHNAHSHAVLPYLQNLHLLPAFLQQLDMESLGKQVDRDGSPLQCQSGGIIWGSAGTNGQHSFHQLLHQGTRFIPADFICAIEGPTQHTEAHLQLLANCFAQSQALMAGKTLEHAKAELLQQGIAPAQAAWLAPFKVCPGNRPSNTLLMQKLTPATLGALIALYEHKVFVQSVLLSMNAFDQWGVELGKILGSGVYKALSTGTVAADFDSSTSALAAQVIEHYKSK